MKLKTVSVLMVMLIVAWQSAFSQSQSTRYGLPSRKEFDKWSVGIHTGPNYFQADIQRNTVNNNSLKDLPFNPMYGIHLAYQFTHTTALRIGGTMGKFTAENEESIKPKTKKYLYRYEGPIREAFLDFVFTSGNISFLKRNKRFHLVGSVGAGIFNFDGELTNIDPRIGEPFVQVRTGNVTEGMLTIGLGFKYRIGKRFDAGITYDFRKTLTDKMDGINKPETETDNYSILNLNINYTFGKKNQQLEWVNPVEIVYNDMAEIKDKMDLLSGDKDKDGVADIYDKDNSTPEGVKVYGDGTAVDTDGDGIPDHLDADPYSTKGAQVDATGAERDSDGDGVPDSRDLEPNTPKGTLVNFQGISIGDNIAGAGVAATAVGWLPSIFFDTDKSDIKPNQQDRLLVVARMLKRNGNVKLKIIGHTDIDAGEDYNMRLGQRRADAVKNHLIKVYGIDGARLVTESRGKKEQFAKGIKAMNRRVDFEVIR
jgi:OOP family OmpA-OmpF porin